MIDLSDTIAPSDINITVTEQGGYLTVSSRDAVYEEVKKDIAEINAVYGIPVQYISEIMIGAGMTVTGRKQIQVVAWEAGIRPTLLAEKLKSFFEEKGYATVVVYSK